MIQLDVHDEGWFLQRNITALYKDLCLKKDIQQHVCNVLFLLYDFI